MVDNLWEAILFPLYGSWGLKSVPGLGGKRPTAESPHWFTLLVFMGGQLYSLTLVIGTIIIPMLMSEAGLDMYPMTVTSN